MSDAESLFERRRKAPLWWRNLSADLRAGAAAIDSCQDGDAAGAVVKDYELGAGFEMSIATSGVRWMLAGMSLELMFKAVLVVREKEPPSIHDLRKLAQQANLTLSAEQNALLDILTHSIVWEGRYPVPKTEERMEELEDLVMKNLYTRSPVGIHTPNHALSWEAFNAIWLVGAAAFRDEWSQRYPAP